MAVRTYGRWQDFLLGGVLGYALTDLALVGLAPLYRAVTTSRPAVGSRPPTPAPPEGAPTTGPSRQPPARETLFGLIGVFTGISGLLAGATDPARLAAAVAAGAVATTAVALLLRRSRTGSRRQP